MQAGINTRLGGQAGAGFVPRVGALVAPGTESSSPSWWELIEIISRVQVGQRM